MLISLISQDPVFMLRAVISGWESKRIFTAFVLLLRQKPVNNLLFLLYCLNKLAARNHGLLARNLYQRKILTCEKFSKYSDRTNA